MNSHKTLNKTEYWVYNDDPKLPVVIMIHGLRGTHHGLDLIAKQLNEYRVIIPDLPAFGETKPLETIHSIKNYATWLDSFISALNLPTKPVLLGHSFGSIIVSHYAEKCPHTIKKLILVNPIGAPALENSNFIINKLTLFYYWLGYRLPKSIGKRLLSSRSVVIAISVKMVKTNDKKIRKYIHSQHLQHFSTFNSPKTLNEAFKASITHNVREIANKINVPTLLIAGELDEITPVEKQQELQKLFPDAKLEVVNKVGHLTHYETPEIVADAIKEFIS